MKVGIEVQRLFRKQKFGIEVSAIELIRRLQKDQPGCEFVVYARNDVDRACLTESENLRIRHVSGKVFFDFEHFYLPLAAKTDRVDLLHCTGNTTPLFSPVPVVQTLHDVIFMDPISTSDTLYQQFGNYYRRKLVPIVTRKSDEVITVSNFEKERIVKRLNIDESRIRVVYNGIDENRFRLITDPRRAEVIRQRYGLPEQFILFLGNTAARKNSLRVIEAYAQYASRSVNPMPIVTPGLPAKFVAQHLEQIKQSDKQKYFFHPGYIQDEDLAALYNISTLFLYPSLSEGFGMPLAEAMACGCPVITSNRSCLPEIAGDAAILVDPENVEAIASAIDALLSNEAMRKRKSEDGIRNARRFSWHTTAQQVFEIYEKVYVNKQRSVSRPTRVAYEVP